MLGGVLAAAALAAPAPAQELPENNSGTGQYVEPVPDAGGDRPANPGPGGGQNGASPRGGLPSSARDGLPPGDEGQILERIATDPGSGAPSEGRGGGRSRDGGAAGTASGGDTATGGRSDGGVISALGSAATGDDGPAIPLMILAAVGLTLAVAGARIRTRRT